jgi:hypothetical protein
MATQTNDHVAGRSAPDAAVRYVYEFSAWPAERSFNRAVYDLFRQMTTRIAMEFTEEEFDLFRDALNSNGITLREISRVPYQEPEPVL